jgi:hypothetical protein
MLRLAIYDGTRIFLSEMSWQTPAVRIPPLPRGDPCGSGVTIRQSVSALNGDTGVNDPVGCWGCERFSTAVITVRKALWHLPSDFQIRLLQAVIAKAERDELGSPLERVAARRRGSGLELEFRFRGCSDREAMHYALATLRDAAASIADIS